VIGAVSFVLDLPVFGTEKLVTQGLGISFMMQAWWVFCICSLLFVVVSLLTPAPVAEKIDGLTWERPFTVIFGKKVEAISDPRIIAGLLLLTMAVLYYIFR
jgi:SSS family solute:Na+ symporter